MSSQFLLRNMFSLHDVLEDFNEVSPVVVPSSFRSYVVSSESRVIIPTGGAAELDRMGAPRAVSTAAAPNPSMERHYPQAQALETVESGDSFHTVSSKNNPLAEPLTGGKGSSSQSKSQSSKGVAFRNEEPRQARTPSAPRGGSSGTGNNNYKTPPPRGLSRG